MRRVTGDPGLEPQRKDYLVQHIMASRYVVAQQMRLEDAVVTPSLDPVRTFAATCAMRRHMRVTPSSQPRADQTNLRLLRYSACPLSLVLPCMLCYVLHRA